MILKSTNLLLNEKLKKSLGYTRSKFNIAINEPNSAVCYRTKTLEAKKNYVTGFGEGWGLGWLYVDGKYAQTGKLFPIGSFGHCGHTGTSMFFSREKNMYVIILTNATRFLNMKNNFNGYDYGKICEMRADIHNAVSEDLK